MAAETDRKACTPPPDRRSRWAFALLALCVLSGPAQAMEDVWSRLPRGIPADSLGPALRRIEDAGPAGTSAAAAFALGQFHHARGEYRLAASAFGRAAARLQGDDHTEARYRQGLAWLGERDPGRARAAFEEVAMLSQPFRALAQLGLARAYALAGEPERELSVLRQLLDRPAGEAEPATLARYAALCDRSHRESEARAARERLAKRWPRSFEAALLPPAGSETPP
jgi:tetratricopeptide (TPR) repeat protein